MNTEQMSSWLGFGTLLIGLLIAVILWARFMRKPENRHPMRGERERNIEEIREEAADKVKQGLMLNAVGETAVGV